MTPFTRFCAAVAVICLGLAGCKEKPTVPTTIDEVPVTETVSIPGLNGAVDVIRDEWGRPHIYAEDTDDLLLAVGYVMASDRLLQMDLMRRFAAGTTAELAGVARPELVEDDFTLRVLGLRRTAQAIYDGLDPDDFTRKGAESFSVGVNIYIDRVRSGEISAPLEYSLLQYPVADFPAWSPVDSLAIGRLLSFDQSFFGDIKAQVLDRVRAAQAVYDGTTREGIECDVIFRSQAAVDGSIIDPSATRTGANNCPMRSATINVPLTAEQTHSIAVATDRTLRHPLNSMWDEAGGSNNWVVSGTHTASGAPMLANDPHLGLTVPSIWYQLHISNSGTGDLAGDIAGVALPGVPNILIGHNGRVAWGITNVIPDVTDNYSETYEVGTGANGVDRVLYNGQMVDLIPMDAVLQTRSSINAVAEETRRFWLLPHRAGSIVPDSYDATNGTALSWRWTGFEPTNEATMFADLVRAQDTAGILAARDSGGVPPTNLVFITDTGDIGWDTNALYPIRDDNDGDPYTDPIIAPLPGDGSHEWIGYLDRNTVPADLNPARGWIQTANQDLLGQTLDNDPLNDPVYIGPAFAVGFRGARIAELLDDRIGAGADMTVDDMFRIQGDVQSPLGKRMTPHILAAINGNPAYATAAAVLTDWGTRGYVAGAGMAPAKEGISGDENASAASLFNVWLSFFTERLLHDELDQFGDAIPNTDQFQTRGMLLLLEDPQSAFTYDAAIGDSWLFDDINTVGTTETREDIILAALDDALAWLASAEGFGNANPNSWLWGDKHRLTLESVLGAETFSYPGPSNTVYPGGFPRHGDNFSVDVANWGLRGRDFTYGGGASMRLVIEAIPDAFKMHMAFPGGSSGDSNSPFYANQAEMYAGNGNPEFWFYEKDVSRNAVTHTVLEP